MACPAVTTGPQFLVTALAHLDCQAQTLGSFGFQALAQPGSVASVVLTGLLTLFIAIYGIRLLFGPGDEPRDLVNAVLKVGIVLTLAVSWPAWRVVAYDTVLYGPSEVAASIMPATLPPAQSGLPQRLQSLDQGIADVTYIGTGRITGDTMPAGIAREFQSVALGDSTGLGFARPIFLASTIGSLGLLRIAGGLLLALAPLIAGLLLFDATRGFFAGWLRGLAFVAIGSLGATLLLSVQVAVMEPWLIDVIGRRNAGLVTPMAPTEALALASAFGIAMTGMLFVLARVTFQNAWPLRAPILARWRAEREARAEPALQLAGAGAARIPVHSRALAISESVEAQVRREEGGTARGDRVRVIGINQPAGPAQTPGGRPGAAHEPLGSGYRRAGQRGMQSQRKRDDRA